MKRYPLFFSWPVVSTNHVLFVLGLICAALAGHANPPKAEWVIIMPNGAGRADGSGYFPLEQAFDGEPVWDTSVKAVTGTVVGNFVPTQTNRVGYIDFGPDFDQVHIMEVWTQYRGGSNPLYAGFDELWWDDDTDMNLDDGIPEERINFNSGYGVPPVKAWVVDARVREAGGLRPPRRYLMVRTGPDYESNSTEFALVGYYYDGPVPPEYADQPQFRFDANTIYENENWRKKIGNLLLTSDGDLGDYTFRLDPSWPDNAHFAIEGTELWAIRSLDYERQPLYLLELVATDAGGNEHAFDAEVRVLDKTGAFDTNGPVTAEVAAAYPQVNAGDYVIWNMTNRDDRSVRYMNGEISISYPNKVLVKADNYSSIRLDMTNASGLGTDRRIPVTNFLGQVYTNLFYMENGSYWRLTGLYDPAKGLGHPDFLGCVGPEGGEQFGFSQGTYGIWGCNEWASENGRMVEVRGHAIGWEIDHLEISDGGFAGLNILERNDDSVNMDHGYLHHLYIHDIGAEGIYLGSTQPEPQHLFSHLTIENVVILRAGAEALQLGRLSENCLIRNSVFWGAMDWLSPFLRYQDNTVQIRVTQGGTVFRDNVMLAGGEKFLNLANIPRADVTPSGEPLLFENNLAWGCRGPLGSFQSSATDGVTTIEFANNFFGGFEYDYDIVYDVVNSEVVIASATAGGKVAVTNNVYDHTRGIPYRRWGGGTPNFVATEGNVQKLVVAPKFVNLLGQGEKVDVLRWMRWTARIGEEFKPGVTGTKKGQPVTYKVGDIVQHGVPSVGRTRFYRCLKENELYEPPLEGDDTWELLVWSNGEKTQYYPPDDARLVEGSFYHSLGMGPGGERTIDGDGDDLPDRWERRYGLNPLDGTGQQARDGDLDGDSLTNYQEFIFRTNPLVPDVPELIRFANDDGGTYLRATPPSGRSWIVEWSDGLSGNWNSFNQLSESDGQAVDLDVNFPLDGTSRFYRLRVELEADLDLLP